MKFNGLDRYAGKFPEYTELRAQENVQNVIAMLNGDVTANARSAQGGISARAYKDGVWGFASTPETSDAAINHILEQSVMNARFLASKSGQNLDKALPSRPGSADKDFATKKTRFDQKSLIEFVKTLDEYCVKTYPWLASRLIQIASLDMEKTLFTADKSQAYSLTPRALIYVSMTKIENNEPVDLYDVYGGFGQFEDVFVKPEDMFVKIDELAGKLEQKAKGIYAKPGTHDVVLGPDLAGILAHEAIGHTVEADLVLGGSVAADMMGKESASPLVTLVDFANTAMGKICPVPLWFDDEGVEARDAVLIDKGILKSFMHNKFSAQHFGVEPTGNARAFGFYDEPLIRMRNTAILPGTSKLSDMIASIDNGYYFTRSSNGQADSTSEFMFGVVMGYEIKNGKIGSALRNATISGIAFDMLKTVTMISDDMSWSCAGMCGKKQPMPVGMGGPAIRCRINVGGRL
ncbi:MAG: TldD/PmbA family protein [Treponema sp.]|jgi:TldD protein|nr:TldD/PmbA family protein [Treponema sp.]